MLRRRFINWMLATSGGTLLAAILYPLARFLSPPILPESTTRQIEAGPTNDPDLLSQGFKILRFGAEPVILIRVADDDFRAFSATCTHLDCIVEFQKGRRRIWCNCHGGEYDLHGQRVAGPPPRPLQAFTVDLVANGGGRPSTIVVSRQRT